MLIELEQESRAFRMFSILPSWAKSKDSISSTVKVSKRECNEIKYV